jgi:UDP-N-acetylglucosamine--N-acetylmuramyl-(pentapeptide) pyrophosphoryl-undecaprenol N-acetylglucosamine transferase
MIFKAVSRNLVFACGGTGGHIFPALSVGEEICRRNPLNRILYVCGKKDIESAIFNVARSQNVASIEGAPFQGAFSFGNPLFLLKSVKGFAQSLRLLSRDRRDLVLGFGGYASFPVLMAAKALNIPTMLHEQNVVPGMANRWMAGQTQAVALSFAETERHLPRVRNKRVTGNPVRSRVERECRTEALDFFGFSPAKKTLLILGGSQGAESINTLFLQCLPHLSVVTRQELQVLHLCGRMNPQDSEKICAQEGIFARAYSFFDAMDLAYGVTDFCVGRAGATFLAEIRIKRVPVLLVPYPFGDGHQRANAEMFQKECGARIAEQKELDSKKLAMIIEEMMNEVRNGTRLPAIDAPAKALNAREALADYIETCIESKIRR